LARYYALVTAERPPSPNIDDLISELRHRVEARRSSGAYPPGLEEELASHFQRIMASRPEKENTDLTGPLERAASAVSFDGARITKASQVPGGQALHRAIARLVARQTEGILQQVQRFANPVVESLIGLATAVEELRRQVGTEVANHLGALYEQVAAHERALIGPLKQLEELNRRVQLLEVASTFKPWYAQERFEEEFRGSQADLLERYRDVAERLRSSGPILDFGCGRGELLILLNELGVEARGVEIDLALVQAATERGLDVQHADGIEVLGTLDDASLGALVLIQVVEHLSPQQTLDLVLLAAQKVRPGGQVLIETVNPQSLYVYAHAFYLDPTHVKPVHPSYLEFLFREAGFAAVALDWRSLPQDDDRLEEVTAEDSALEKRLNKNISRLNQLLFAPQDYLVTATR
jgi:2-polyprenyl-3-methyl-5-hydroxy-6-metoxy-1,4-benzoquinol methylase